MKRKLLILLAAAVLVASVAGAAPPKINVVSIGDSWATEWCEDMERVIRTHGVPVEVWNKGIYGTTSTIWATPGAMIDVLLTLVEHPEIDWAVVSLGGNDLIDGYLLGGYGDEVFPIVEQSVRVVIDQILALRPNMKIAFNGYDFPNFEHTLDCIVQGQLYLGGNTYTQNQLLARLTDVAATIAADYPQVYAVDFLGTLQAARGVPGAPNYYRPSPSEFYPDDSECIHPRSGGYWYVQQRLYDGFFEPLNQPADDDDDNDDNDNDNDDDDNDNNDDDAVGDDDDDNNDDNDNDNNDDDDNDNNDDDDNNDDNDDDSGGCF